MSLLRSKEAKRAFAGLALASAVGSFTTGCADKDHSDSAPKPEIVTAMDVHGKAGQLLTRELLVKTPNATDKVTYLLHIVIGCAPESSALDRASLEIDQGKNIIKVLRPPLTDPSTTSEAETYQQLNKAACDPIQSLSMLSDTFDGIATQAVAQFNGHQPVTTDMATIPTVIIGLTGHEQGAYFRQVAASGDYPRVYEVETDGYHLNTYTKTCPPPPPDGIGVCNINSQTVTSGEAPQ